MPLKCKDPGAFTIPCTLGSINFSRVLLDNGASINVLPYSIFKTLKVGDLKETGIAIQLADKSIVHPKGVLEDVLVQVKHLVFPADFYVIDMGDDSNLSSSSILLGRPFLKTSRTKFDSYNGSLTMEFDGDVIHFNISDPIKPIEDVLSVNLVSTIVPNIDNCVFTTNRDLQVLVVDKNVVIGTPNSRLVKREEKEEVNKSEKSGKGTVLEVPMTVNEMIAMVKEKKKRKRRKWKWLKVTFPCI